MKKRLIVLSLGGSLIIPDKIDTKYLGDFRKIILKHTRNYKFIIVCGGGSIARKYISALKKTKSQNLVGISATRMNAKFMTYFFDINIKHRIPHTTKQLKKLAKKQDIVFCGALECKAEQTSDGTAAEVARKFQAKFVNLTNVKGLYDKNPKKYKNAKFIPKVSWKEFYKFATKEKFTPGQHFVLDHTAAKTIMEEKIPTCIIGKDLKQLDNFLKGKKFTGTIIED